MLLGKILEENILYVEQGYANEKLYSDALIATDINWINPDKVKEKFTCTAKFRYRQKDSKVTVTILEDDKVKFDFQNRNVRLHQDKLLYFMMVKYVLVEGRLIK